MVCTPDDSAQDTTPPATPEGAVLADIADVRHPDRPSATWERTRLVVLEGASNFRDIGGHDTRDGRTVKRGLIFRSDHLHTLTDADVDRIHALGIRTVHDFRVDKERARQPSRFPRAGGGGSTEVIVLSTPDAPSMNESIFDLVSDMLAGRVPMAPASFWEDNYADLVNRIQPMLVALFRSLASADRLPALYHCAGGKDRTGVATSLLLEVLGVDADTIMDDFLATNVFRTPTRLMRMAPQLERLGITEEQISPMLGVTRPALERAWATIRDDHGGTEAFLLSGGLEPSAFERLRDLLLE